MKILLFFSGLVAFFISLIIFVSFAESTNDGDIWAGIVIAWLWLISGVLVIASGVLWIFKYFSYAGGAA